MLCGGCDGVVQPVQIVVPFAGLHPAPGKLAHAHHVDARLLHQGEVCIPAGLWPLFGIPRRSQHDGWGRRRCLGEKRGCDEKNASYGQLECALQSLRRADLIHQSAPDLFVLTYLFFDIGLRAGEDGARGDVI
jgi:hypothetical protein